MGKSYTIDAYFKRKTNKGSRSQANNSSTLHPFPSRLEYSPLHFVKLVTLFKTIMVIEMVEEILLLKCDLEHVLLAPYNFNVAKNILENAPRNAQYISPNIQKEILYIFNKRVHVAILIKMGTCSIEIFYLIHVIDTSSLTPKKEILKVFFLIIILIFKIFVVKNMVELTT
ncbi:hypothetical protein CR513_51927, partial [Mucuna pruriens]